MISYVRGRGPRTLSDAEIIGRYLAGGSTDAIGQDANCPPDTVLYLVRRAGHKTRPRGPRARHKLLPLDDQAIIRLYTIDGLSGPTIAGKCGTTPSTIYKILQAHGINRRRAGDVSRAICAAMKSARRRKGQP